MPVGLDRDRISFSERSWWGFRSHKASRCYCTPTEYSIILSNVPCESTAKVIVIIQPL